MLGKAFGGTPRVTVDGKHHDIRSPAELEALLGGRTSPSSERLAQLVALSDRDLSAALAAYDDHETHLEALVNAWMTGAAAAQGGSEPPHDHGWHEILGSVGAWPRGHEELRYMAAERYRQYLRAAVRCVRSIAQSRQRPGAEDDSMDRLGGSRGTPGVQRALFEFVELAGEATRSLAMERLPKGERVSIRFGAHQSMPLRLAKHEFTVVSGNQFLLVDDSGADLRLPGGRVVLGRGASCSVMLDPRFRSVSRKHLVIELEDDGTAHFTDISSMGTFLPASLV